MSLYSTWDRHSIANNNHLGQALYSKSPGTITWDNHLGQALYNHLGQALYNHLGQALY